MNERIKLLRKELNLSQEKFGEKLGVTKSSISSLESGRFNATDSIIKLICREFNVDYHWLTTGEGEPFKIINPDNSIIDMAATVVKNDKESFQKDFLYILSLLTEEQWSELEHLADFMSKIIKNYYMDDKNKA